MSFIKSVVLVAFMISITFSNKAKSMEDFSFDLDVINAEFSTEQGILHYETKSQVGTIFARKFIFDSDAFSFYIQDQKGVDVVVSADAKKLYFEKMDVGYGHSLKNLKFLEKISFFSVRNLVTQYNEDELSIAQEYLLFKSNKNNLYEFSNFNFHCPFNSTHVFGSNYEKLLYSCMNSASLEKANVNLPSPMIKVERENLQFKTLIDRFSTSADKLIAAGSSLALQAKLTKMDTSVNISDFSFDCMKEEFTGTDVVNSIIRGCHNSMKFTNRDLTFLTKDLLNKTSQVTLKVGELQAAQGKFVFNGDQLSYKGNSVKDERSSNASIKKFTADCKKKVFNREKLTQDLTDGCYENLNLNSEEISYSFNDKKKESKSEIKVLKSVLATNATQVSIRATNVDGKTNKNEVSIKNLVASCKKSSTDKTMSERMLKNCLASSKLTATEIKYSNIDDKSGSEIHKLDFAFLNDQFTVDSSKIVYRTAENAKISVNNAKLECARAKSTKEKIDFEELLGGCFDSSKINISSVEYLDPKNNAKFNISSIALDKNRIDVSIPSAVYEMNKASYEVENMKIHCALSANFDLVKTKDWKKVVSNCLRDLSISMGKIRDQKKGNGGLLKLNKYDNVELVVKNNQVVLIVVAKNSLGLSAKAKIKGKVYFTNNDTKIVFEIEKTKISLWGAIPFPSEGIFAGIIKTLVKEKHITQKDNVITVDLSAKD